MKKSLLCVLFSATVSTVLLAQTPDKPRVFVQGKGSQDVTSNGSGGGGSHWGAWGSSSTIDSHDESMEVTKDLQKNCGGVMVTLNQANADYTVMLNRESKKNRGLLRSNSQMEVANRAGDVLGTNATHTVGNAAKDACQLIVADWQTHGRLPGASEAAPAAKAEPAPAQVAPAVPAVTPAVATGPAVVQSGVQQSTAPAAQLVTISAPATEAGSSTATASTVSGDASQSLGDAARRAKQHAACLQLAKDNPSISCN